MDNKSAIASTASPPEPDHPSWVKDEDAKRALGPSSLVAGHRRPGVCCVGQSHACSAASGSGGDAVEAVADLLSIARLPPGHDPGAGCGVATAARQRWHLAIRHFGLFGGQVAAAND